MSDSSRPDPWDGVHPFILLALYVSVPILLINGWTFWSKLENDKIYQIASIERQFQIVSHGKTYFVDGFDQLRWRAEVYGGRAMAVLAFGSWGYSWLIRRLSKTKGNAK